MQDANPVLSAFLPKTALANLVLASFGSPSYKHITFTVQATLPVSQREPRREEGTVYREA